jgi:hypothetical protein
MASKSRLVNMATRFFTFNAGSGKLKTNRMIPLMQQSKVFITVQNRSAQYIAIRPFLI